MAYELSFSPEFFLGEGEPYDRSDLCVNRKGKPTSVWSAIAMMAQEEPQNWKNMAKEVFDLPQKDAHLLMAEAVLDKIRETNTCSNLSSPVEVWIDSDGTYTVEVYE